MSDTLIWIGIWALLLWGVGSLRQGLLVKRVSKLLFLPGVLVEALIRALACKITATPIEKWSPFGEGEPFLRTGPCPVRRVGVPITMALRMSLTFVFTFALLKFAVPELPESTFGLPTFLHHPKGIQGSGGGFILSLGNLPVWLSLHKALGLTLVYILFSLMLATGLSRLEFFAALWGWAGLFGLSTLGSFMGIQFGFLTRGWFIRRWYLPECWSSFSLMVVLSFLALLFVGALHLLPTMSQKLKPTPTGATQGLSAGGR